MGDFKNHFFFCTEEQQVTDTAPADLMDVVTEEPVEVSEVEPDIVTETDVIDTIDATTETGVEDQTTQAGGFSCFYGRMLQQTLYKPRPQPDEIYHTVNHLAKSYSETVCCCN